MCEEKVEGVGSSRQRLGSPPDEVDHLFGLFSVATVNVADHVPSGEFVEMLSPEVSEAVQEEIGLAGQRENPRQIHQRMGSLRIVADLEQREFFEL